ncbi:MAG: type II toxin-antitoxin system VapC family toxin [Woeseiaceae bacterium]
MAARIEGYVDTSALIAFVDRSDTYNSLFRQLFSDPPALVTTTLVIAEGHAWFLRRYDRHRALQFMSMVEIMKPLRVLGASARDQAAGIDFLRKFSDQDLTMTDAIGLHVMAIRNVRHCWSTDFHLGLTGVPLVIHQH